MKNSKYWWLGLIKGVVLLILSFFVFRHPADALLGLTSYLGVSLMITGLVLIFSSISSREKNDNWAWKLAKGVIDLFFAYTLLTNPLVSASVFPFIAGFWMIVSGVMIFSGSFKLKKEGDSRWWMNFIAGILTAVFGYFVTTNFVVGAFAISFWMALGIFFYGIVFISGAFRMKKVSSTVSKD